MCDIRYRKDLEPQRACARIKHGSWTAIEKWMSALPTGRIDKAAQPIHRHLQTSETVICIEGCLDWIFYEELPNVDAGGPVHDGERAMDESNFVEKARLRVCPREGQYGIQVPKGAWHSIVVHEPSTIFEAKDGAYIG